MSLPAYRQPPERLAACRVRTGDPHGDPPFRRLIDLQYRFSRQPGGGRPLSHPLISMLRSLRDGGSIQAASRAQSVSYRHAWGLLRAAEKELGCQLVTWVRGESSVLTERGHALVNAEDLALSRLAPQIDALRAELARSLTPRSDRGRPR